MRLSTFNQAGTLQLKVESGAASSQAADVTAKVSKRLGVKPLHLSVIPFPE
jgi:hypothetical protein